MGQRLAVRGFYRPVAEVSNWKVAQIPWMAVGCWRSIVFRGPGGRSERGGCGSGISACWQSTRGPGAERAFLRCRRGAVGLPTLEAQLGRLRVAEAVLAMSRRPWVDHGVGLERVEWQIAAAWRHLHKLEELVSGSEVWLTLVWGRKK